MSATTERVLPHHLEAERSVLGAILLHNEALEIAAGIVTEGDFYRDAHRRLFATMAALAEQREPIELVTLTNALSRQGTLEAVGGPAYIAALVDGMPRSTNIEHYAGIVREKAQLRAMIRAARAVLEDAYAASDDATDVLARAEARLQDLARQDRARGGFRRLSEILPGVMDQLERWQASPGAVSGVPSGLVDLDLLLRGFQPATLNILAARPGMGKSSLAENVARHAARQGRVCLVFSLEMADQEYAVRSLAAEGRVDSHRMQSGRLSGSDYGRLSHALTDLSTLPLFIADDPYVTVRDVRSQCRRLREQEGRLDLVVVDYTQLMLSEEKSENRAIEVGNITRALKALAKEFALPVLALAQLNRQLEQRQDKRPLLSDTRDSGRIEEDADVVLFIYRDDHYHRDSQEPGVAELIIAKHRSGPVGTVKVVWQREFTRFDNLAVDRQAEDRRLPMGDR